MLSFGQRAAPGPDVDQEAKLFRCQPLAVAQTEVALRLPAHGVPVIVCGDRQGYDISPLQPVLSDELVCFEAGRCTLTVVRGAQHAEQFDETVDRFRIEGDAVHGFHAHRLRAGRSASRPPSTGRENS